MKHLLMILFVVFASCTNQQADVHKTNDTSKHEHETAGTDSSVVSATKWKADPKTRQHVDALMQITDNKIYETAAQRNQLYTALQSRIDLMIQDCTMKGAEHDALHVWLEKLLEDMKLLKDTQQDYNTIYTTIRKDIAAFYQSFE